MTRILLAEDDRSLRYVVGRALAGRGWTVDETDDGNDALRRLGERRYDVAVVDVRIPGMTGLELLGRARSLPHPPAFVVITAQSTVENAVAAMRDGAYEYLTKPFDLERLEAVVARAVAERREAGAGARPGELLDGPEDDPGTRTLFGRSAAMQKVFKAIGRVAATHASVLILGESGTGKELVARTIHAYGPWSGGPFVAVNAAAIPETLLESELFGHERGAFTGATERRIGKMRAAEGGTLFLDEIGEMPGSIQAKLLRALQEREFYPLGATRPVRMGARIVAATGRDLSAEVKAGRFRADLFWRLNVVPIVLPPLRERREDVPALAAWFLRRVAADRGEEPRRLSEDAVEWLVRHPWPGNVRELEHALTRAVTLRATEVLRAEDFTDDIGVVQEPASSASDTPGEHAASFEAMVMTRLRPFVRRYTPGEGDRDLYDIVVGTTERALFTLALERTRGNQVKAAQLLGINRNTLRRRLTELGIAPEQIRKARRIRGGSGS
ncbi:sigma-54 dependent transcriptional regulator [Myxococcota bacterium]|nr:sigma-54 dependent transcriptional regulator [Myxococcota bacterium]